MAKTFRFLTLNPRSKLHGGPIQDITINPGDLYLRRGIKLVLKVFWDLP
jgi:hypothetical protein